MRVAVSGRASAAFLKALKLPAPENGSVAFTAAGDDSEDGNAFLYIGAEHARQAKERAGAGARVALIAPPEAADEQALYRLFPPPARLASLCRFFQEAAPDSIERGYIFNAPARELRIDGAVIPLTELERDIIAAIGESGDTPENIAAALWNTADEHSMQRLRTAVHRIRAKAGEGVIEYRKETDMYCIPSG